MHPQAQDNSRLAAVLAAMIFAGGLALSVLGSVPAA